MSAAGLATKIVDDPLVGGRFYQQAMLPVLHLHETLEAMIHGEPFHSDADAVTFWSRWRSNIPLHVRNYLRIANGRLAGGRPAYPGLAVTSALVNRFPSLMLLMPRLSRVRTGRPMPLAEQVNAFPEYYEAQRVRRIAFGGGVRHVFGLNRQARKPVSPMAGA